MLRSWFLLIRLCNVCVFSASPRRSVALSPKVVVKSDPRYFRPTEVETLLGDPSKAKADLGRVSPITLMWGQEMVADDLSKAKQYALLKQHGYNADGSTREVQVGAFVLGRCSCQSNV